MRYALALCIFYFSLVHASAQDSGVVVDNHKFTLPAVVLRSNLDYASILRRIKDDTTFYKAFRTLRILEYSAYNNIRIPDKKGNLKATYNSKTWQHRTNGCRTTEFLEQQTTGDFFDNKG